MSFFDLKKLGVVGIGFIATETLGQAYDYVLYPLVIATLGIVWGGITMTVLSIALTYALVWGYSQTHHDWFGFEWMRLQADSTADTRAGALLRFILKKGRMTAFILLSIEDPFKAHVFIRGKKDKGSGFDRTDWKWFLTANLIGNLVWIGLVSGALEIGKHVLEFAKHVLS